MKTKRKTIALIATARAEANAFLKRQLRLAGLAGLAPTHGNILDALLRHGDMPMGSLADHIRRDKSTVTALVAKLEGLGYVERKTADADSRLTLVGLTQKGGALREVFERISERMFEVAMAGISEDEAAALERALAKIIANFTHGRG